MKKLAKSAEEAVFMGEVYKITKELVNTNTKADPSVLDINENILSTDEEKLNRWSEHFKSVLTYIVSPFCCNDRIYFTNSSHYIVSAIKSIPS